MKKAVILFLTALIAVSAFSGCGSKKQDYDHDDSSRVLYDDNEPVSSEDEEEIEDEESEDDKKDSSSSELNGRRSEDESKTSTSSDNGSVVSTAKSNAKTTSSAASSKTGVIYHVSTKPSNVGSTSSSSYSSYSVSSSYVSSSEKSSDTDTSSDDSWYSSETDSSDSDILNSDIMDTDSEDDIIKGSFDYSDTSFVLYGTTISAGDRFADIDEMLGGSNSSSGFVYYYDEFTVKTNGDEENEIITQITISSPTVKISKDICVGSTSKELLEAFGDPTYGTTYEIGDKTVEFVMVNDMVAEIIFESLSTT